MIVIIIIIFICRALFMQVKNSFTQGIKINKLNSNGEVTKDINWITIK